jgi:penicillin amidase
MRRAHIASAVVALSWVTLAGLEPPRQEENAADLSGRAKAALAQTAGTIGLAGLQQPVEVIRDRWGVPHIYARNVHDLFFAQGFVAAQDRLWQLDLWRRNAEGKLAEILGPTGVKRDTFARLLRYRGDMDAEWRSYGRDAKAIIEAFVEGVNAQVARATEVPGRLPIEFQLTGTRPEPWTPEVVIGRMAGYVMTRNARSEVQRARQVRQFGALRVTEMQPVDPPVAIAVPEGLDLDDITDAILDIASDASELVRFPDVLPAPVRLPERFGFGRAFDPAGNLVGDDTGHSPSADSRQTPAEPDSRDETWRTGSNNWVVAGSRSSTGKPLLANDPHRVIALPSLRYTAHLNAPGWNVIGAGEPALPGIAAGHNDRVAFGFTIVGMDQQDLYVERLDPQNPDRYMYRGSSEPMTIEREQIKVRGEASRAVEMRFTRHGPVLHVDRARQRAYVLRWVGTEPGAAGYLRSLALDQARDWAGFLDAVSGWKVPSENIIYADVDGNIGWVAAGLAPVRPNWNGLLPVPGHEGRFEWSGFLPLSDLPQAYNPAKGYIATANHNILPPGYSKMLGYEWGAPHRFNRIVEVLEEKVDGGSRRFTVSDFERLQHDALSVVARAICGALSAAEDARRRAGAEPEPPTRARAVEMLTRWDSVVARDSAVAALYELWLPRLSRAAVEALVPAADRPMVGASLSTERLLQAIRPAATDPAVQALLIGPSLDAAWAEAVRTMGAEPSEWSWGRIHRSYWEHPLSFTRARREVFNLRDVPRGGDATTPFATGGGGRQTSGASFREVIDVADWDRSTAINVPGMSGQPGSPFYGNLLTLWADERYHPLAFSRAAVEEADSQRLELRPLR